jgi:predicted transcriptional regulator
MSDTNNPLIELTAEVVAAYVSNNSVQPATLPVLIASVHGAVSGLRAPTAAPAQEPKVNPKRSVFPDYIICLEDGKRFRSLKRHLETYFGLTPDEYRSKWSLPHDYPMVAPNYAAARSLLAKRMGLGRKAASKVPPKAKAKRSKK